MANRTVKDAVTVKGTNPQYLVEKIIRTRVYDSRYWKEECFALSAELLVDKAMQLKYVGGIFGNNVKPTPFLCLVLKMLQIQPEKDIVVEFIKNEDYKYVRVLGAYYMRLTGTSLDCYKYIEPLLNDYRKLRVQNREGEFELTFVDEFVDRLLHEERMCDVILPRIQRRQVHEESNDLEPRVSALDDDLDQLPSDEETDDDENDAQQQQQHVAPSRGTHPPSSSGGGVASSRHHHSSRHEPRERRDHRYSTSDRRDDRDHRWERRPEHPRDKHRERESDRYRDREPNRHRGEPDRFRDEPDKHRDRHRDRERHRDERRHREDRDHHHHHHRHSGTSSSSRHKERRRRHQPHDEQSMEVTEANQLRAKLGLPPLRP